MKRIIVFIAFALLMFPQTGWATVYNGTCGTGLTWTLDTSTGLLIITGSGRMTEYTAGAQPWYSYRDYITSCRIEAGVQYVAEQAFYNCTKLSTISYPLNLDDTFPDFECTPKTLPIVVTNDATSVKTNAAVLNGQVTGDGGLVVSERRICWGATADALTNCQTLGTGTGAFNWSISGLTENTTYYFQAYATNEKGTASGEIKSFKTPKKEDNEGVDSCGHAWVRLWADGPKWATVNLGATAATDAGNYYMWGGTTPNPGSYTWANVPYKGSNTNTAPYTKYGYAKDGRLVLEPADDAATQAWGCGWRTPTYEEYKMLKDSCNIKYTISSYSPLGSYYTFTSKSTGKSIIMPTAGYGYNSSIFRVGTYARYMTSTSTTSPSSSTKNRDVQIFIWYSKSSTDPTEDYKPNFSLSDRFTGYTVRAVKD